MKFENAKEIYNEIISSDNDEIFIKWNEAVKERKVLNLITIVISIIVDIIILYVNFKSINSDVVLYNGFKIYIIIIMFIVDVIIYGTISLFGKKKKEFKREFKKNIVNKIISNFYDNSEYFPEKKMPMMIYNEPQYEGYDDYYSEDYLEATIDGKYGIMMAEVQTEEEETYTDSDGNMQTRTTTLFHGLFAKIDMEKSINSDLDIKTNNMLSGLSLLDKSKLEMDSRRIRREI